MSEPIGMFTRFAQGIEPYRLSSFTTQTTRDPNASRSFPTSFSYRQSSALKPNERNGLADGHRRSPPAMRNGNCTLYIQLPGAHGLTQVSGEPDDSPERVYLAGPQKVLSIFAIRKAHPGIPTSITMAGPVFREDDSFDEVTKVWEALVDIGTAELMITPSDVTALSERMLRVTPDVDVLDDRERASAGAVIAALAAMSKTDITKPWGVAEAIMQAGATAGIVMPGRTTIVKFLELGKAAMASKKSN